MISGCAGPATEEANEEERLRAEGMKYCETTNMDEPFNYTTGQWITNNENTQQSTTNTQSNQKTPQTNTPKTTTQKTTTTTQTRTPQACTHSWVQEYAGYDSSTGKIKYKVYCSKCGEIANYVWY